MSKRLICLFFAYCFVLGLLITRLAILSQNKTAQASRVKNSKSVVADSTRGMIYDCNLQPLVNETRENYIAIKPDNEAFELNKSYILNEEIENAQIQNSQKRTAIARARESAVENSDNLLFTKTQRYKNDGLCVHLIGYLNKDLNGVSGIEKSYDDFLKASGGQLKIICNVDALGNPLKGEKLKAESSLYNSPAGIELTVDKNIQEICETAIKNNNISCGAVVVLDVKTSQIRAMASVPEFSQNSPGKSLNDTNSPFVNRAVTPFSVGSVYKVVVAAAALENGIPTTTAFMCNGSIQIGDNTFSCHKKDGHGELDMYGATANSCNPYFINLASAVGKEKICELSRSFGLGKSIELFDGYTAASGNMPNEKDLVSPQDLANLSFGQGELLASPLQMAAVYACIANNGVYTRPSVIKCKVDKNKNEFDFVGVPASRKIMTDETAKTLQTLLYNTVENGSGHRGKPENISVAGKTATAQSGQFKDNGEEIIQAWFCGYFPYENPEYTVAVLKENGSGGSADCAPVFREIAENITKQGL